MVCFCLTSIDRKLLTLVKAKLGDTIYTPGLPVRPLTSFEPLQPMVFAGFFPVNAADLPTLDDSIKRVRLYNIFWWLY